MKPIVFFTIAIVLSLSSTIALAQTSSSVAGTTSGTSPSAKVISKGPSLSEANHIPAKSVLELSASPTYVSRKYFYTRRSAPFSRDIETTALGLGASYGVNESTALSLQTDFGQTFSKHSDKNFTYSWSGFSDFVLNFEKIFARGSRNIILGITANFSPGIAENATQDRVGNRLSGGNEVEIRLGNEWTLESGPVVGYSGAYRLLAEKESRATDSLGNSFLTSKETGGNEATLAGFLETQIPFARVGSELSFTYKEAIQVKDTYRIASRNEEYGLDPETSVQLSAYGNIQASPTLEVLPRLTLSSLIGRDLNGNEYNSSLGVAAQVSARSSF